MIVKCNLCGGENSYEPGEATLVCSYCGSSLAIARNESQEIEHLLLVHTRNDRLAEAALRSHIAENKRKAPSKISIDFSIVPYFLLEDESGTTILRRASGKACCDKVAPYPPSGKYRYIGSEEAKELLRFELEHCSGARRVLYLPVYSLRYECGKWEGRAEVIGESLQVIAEKLPDRMAERADLGLIARALLLCVAYYLLARAIPNFMARTFAVSLAALLLYSIYIVRERAKG